MIDELCDYRVDMDGLVETINKLACVGKFVSDCTRRLASGSSGAEVQMGHSTVCSRCEDD